MAIKQISIQNARIIDNFYIWEAIQGINNSRSYEDFKISDNYWLYLAYLAASGGGNVTFMGFIDASGNPNYPAADLGDQYQITVKGKIGGAAGLPVEPGDLIEANVDTLAGDQAAVGANWIVTQFGLQQIFEITVNDLAFAVINDLNQTVGNDWNLTVVNDVIGTVGNDFSLTVTNDISFIAGADVDLSMVGIFTVSSTYFDIDNTGKVSISTSLATFGTYAIVISNSTPVNLFSIRNNGLIEAGSAAGALTIGNTSGYVSTISNTFFGSTIAIALSTGSENVAFGNHALANLTTGRYLCAFGEGALQGSNFVTATGSTGLGFDCLLDITTGNYNLAAGYIALSNLTTGTNNTALGAYSLNVLITNTENTAVGYGTGNGCIGDNNIFLGAYAGFYNTIEDNDVFIDSILRANYATQQTDSLIYGKTNIAPATQQLFFNAGRISARYLTLYANNAAAVGGGLVTGDLYMVADAVTGSNIIEIVV